MNDILQTKVIHCAGSEEQREDGSVVKIMSEGSDNLYATSGGRTKFFSLI